MFHFLIALNILALSVNMNIIDKIILFLKKPDSELISIDAEAIENLMVWQFKFADDIRFSDTKYFLIPSSRGKKAVDEAIKKDRREYPRNIEAINDCDDRARRVVNDLKKKFPGGAIGFSKILDKDSKEYHRCIQWIDQFKVIHLEMMSGITNYTIIWSMWE